ncbi:similar to Saccharomyces cerevisiae YOR099W KTR1 Alpha-1,2-mannosyltransferase involved in O-and N-linked protein glycosylation [Geotrichum candidum]|uniref:Similar to Saccharomyces cerevisiae YOR099W KTR1 Alpha-1,2-mannosyltransferase involved in O-and N-linked protein glycosylation n=1 Tax=Geotrichum candidum TaxID=1173061 RepID=A0A0J9XKT2_GEOCN|nr:similar to Saccharomyces cerevisiae YOR099W KTR1 Alpha-1,2-mannosyltransferase involved in O-and N-linked protein glycosylation [Geotrichum candidum]
MQSPIMDVPSRLLAIVRFKRFHTFLYLFVATLFGLCFLLPRLNPNLLLSTASLHQKWSTKPDSILFSLVREEELDGMISSITELQDRFNKKFHYDWLFVSENEFSDHFKETIQATLTSGKAHFEQIPEKYWSYPKSINQKKAAKSRQALDKLGVKYANSESYRHMCRFNSGFFYLLDGLKDYRYYWRVEPNVRFKCDIKEDPFKVMKNGNYSYGWTMTMPEDQQSIETLWPTIKQYLHDKKPDLPADNMLEFITDDDSKTYNSCHYWSNFEIGDLSFFRSKPYQEFFEYLDATGNFFYERWGDAPIHSIAVSLLLPKTKIKHFPHTGYYHEPNQGCPLRAKARKELNCDCNPNKDWTFHFYSCTEKYYMVSGNSRPF